MAFILDKLFGAPPEPIQPGVYHYQAPPDSTIPYRLHLRIEQDGQGLLIVNAATVLHLNQTAAAHAYEIVQGQDTKSAARTVSRRYRVSKQESEHDQETIRQRIVTLATFPDVDPVTFLGLDRNEPYAHLPSAPYRLDLALTYELDPDGILDSLARQRVDRVLSTEEWKRVLDLAWDAGIPHVVFTGGEPTRRSDLVALIQHAEDLGQVTGVLTQAQRLADPDYLEQLAQAGLDHLLVVLLPEDTKSREGLKQALASDIFTAVHLTISNTNWEDIDRQLHLLEGMGVPAISLSSTDSSPEYIRVLEQAREMAAQLEMDLIWDITAPYSSSNPIAIELEDVPQGAGRAWLYIEPDGDVLPTQGINEILGNILRDPWEDIWQKACSRS
ncbi:MAG: radical SAM protein [Anaerolineales bacterium]|nr:radical SAM protein [Anaerolineales bacterium]